MRPYFSLFFITTSTLFLTGCSYNALSSHVPTGIISCRQLSEKIGDFQQSCQTDSDCIRVEHPMTFCYSEIINRKYKDEYDALFQSLDCPADKEYVNNRGNYCEVDTKSHHFCDTDSRLCTTGIRK